MIWNNANTVVDGQKFEIKGLNIWDFEWRPTGEYIAVRDTLYSQQHSFPVYEIISGAVKVTFAAGEFSNCVWGIYYSE